MVSIDCGSHNHMCLAQPKVQEKRQIWTSFSYYGFGIKWRECQFSALNYENLGNIISVVNTINRITLWSNPCIAGTTEFFLNVFTEFAEFSGKKYLSLKGLEPVTSCVIGHDSITVLERHMWETVSLIHASVIQWKHWIQWKVLLHLGKIAGANHYPLVETAWMFICGGGDQCLSV